MIHVDIDMFELVCRAYEYFYGANPAEFLWSCGLQLSSDMLYEFDNTPLTLQSLSDLLKPEDDFGLDDVFASI